MEIYQWQERLLEPQGDWIWTLGVGKDKWNTGMRLFHPLWTTRISPNVHWYICILQDALEWAMKNNLWGHALFLASKMDTKAHANVMTR